MAPELFKAEGTKTQKPYDPFKADVYALGVMLVHMVAKQFPLEFPSGRDPMASTSSFVTSFFNGPRNIYKVPACKELIELAQSMLAYEPKGRPSFDEIMRHSWYKRQNNLLLTDKDTQKSVH